ncbi:MAG: hypothetical protein D6754_09555 [Alphaproteobacteria bacterium]|nr:MAG: hypothetical protein D6754_09555 [Alphaproteobacteria bacterium]
MIMRAGEIFLNGAERAKRIHQDDWAMSQALYENIGGISDFFDFVVTRDRIPLINYQDTFDRVEGFTSIASFLGAQGESVEIDYAPYQEIKAGAIENLARMDFDRLRDSSAAIIEIDAFRWEWRPKFQADPAIRRATLDEAEEKLAHLDSQVIESGLAAFLLGGLVFSGMAQAARAVHHVQPKRARLYLGVAGAATDANPLTHEHEEAIFSAARQDLAGTKARCAYAEHVPPVLPYLINQGEASGPQELLERALKFRTSDLGRAFRAFAADLRGDGIAAREAENISAQQKQEAMALIRPADHADERSRALDVEFGLGLSGPDAKVSGKLRVPGWLRLWWNDWITFDGGLRKTLRRMWLADGAYRDLPGKLHDIWLRA